MSIAEVCEKLGRSPSTVSPYLDHVLTEEGRTSPEPSLDLETFERVRIAFDSVSLVKLRPVFDTLCGEVRYEALGGAIACLRNARMLSAEKTETPGIATQGFREVVFATDAIMPRGDEH